MTPQQETVAKPPIEHCTRMFTATDGSNKRSVWVERDDKRDGFDFSARFILKEAVLSDDEEVRALAAEYDIPIKHTGKGSNGVRLATLEEVMMIDKVPPANVRRGVSV